MKIKNIIFCITFFVVVLCIIFCSCSSHSTIIETKNVDDLTESSTYFYITTNINYDENTLQSDNAYELLDKDMSYYTDLYDTTYICQDCFIKQKHILIGHDYVIELFSVQGVNQTKIINTDNVERIERNTLPEFDEIKIYDKTNQCISAFVNSKEADEILKMIDTSNSETNN